MLVRYRGINIQGVLERPWTKWRVLRTISSTLRFQPNPAKVRGNVFVWSVRSPRTPLDLPNFNLNHEKTSFWHQYLFFNKNDDF